MPGWLAATEAFPVTLRCVRPSYLASRTGNTDDQFTCCPGQTSTRAPSRCDVPFIRSLKVSRSVLPPTPI